MLKFPDDTPLLIFQETGQDAAFKVDLKTFEGNNAKFSDYSIDSGTIFIL